MDLRVAAMLLASCWLILAVFWVAKAFDVKRSAVGGTGRRRWALIVLALVGVGLVVTNLGGRGGAPQISTPLWPFSVVRAVVAVAVSYAGLAISVWARAVLGRNWSSAPRAEGGP